MCLYRSSLISLILVYTVCPGLSVWKFRINTAIKLSSSDFKSVLAAELFYWHIFLCKRPWELSVVNYWNAVEKIIEHLLVYTIKILINAHALINAHPPNWTWKIACFWQYLEKYQPLLNAHWWKKITVWNTCKFLNCLFHMVYMGW